MSKRNHYRNRLGLSAISAILIVVAALALAGLGIVVSKNRVRAIGDEQRKLEDEMRLLGAEITALNHKIEASLTRDRVQPRLTSSGTLLRPITQLSLISLKPPTTPQPTVGDAPAKKAPELAQNTPEP
jgi:hypothetical protein